MKEVNELAVKTSKTTTSNIPRKAAVLISLCLTALALLFVNFRSAYKAERGAQDGREKRKLFPNSQLVDNYQRSNDTSQPLNEAKEKPFDELSGNWTVQVDEKAKRAHILNNLNVEEIDDTVNSITRINHPEALELSKTDIGFQNFVNASLNELNIATDTTNETKTSFADQVELVLVNKTNMIKQQSDYATEITVAPETNHETNPNNQSTTSRSEGRVVLDLNNTYFYWRNTQSRFCDVIRQVTNVSVLGMEQPYHIRHNQPPPLLRATFDCVAITTDNQLGTGNWITGFYAMRVAAALGMVDFEIQCKDGVRQDLHHLISWFTGFYPAPTEYQKWPYDRPAPDDKSACSDRYYQLRIDSMAHEMQSDLRKLAVTLFGSQSDLGWSHPSVPPNQSAMVPGVELDDVVIHFRCGDILGGVNRNDFGIIHFGEYLKWISNETSTLGIVTQPFNRTKFTRSADFSKARDCRQVVTVLVGYLQSALPNTLIRVHNDPGQPLSVEYARMVMSKQLFVSYSSFGIFPAVATFGEGYFQKGNYGVNPWANVVPKLLPNLHMMEAHRKTSAQIRREGLEETIKWLVTPINLTSKF